MNGLSNDSAPKALLPCPFCGNEATQDREAVQCCDCGARIGSKMASRETVRIWWNKRAPSPSFNATGALTGEAAKNALRDLQAFVGVMFGKRPDCVIPETVRTPLGVDVKLGAIMRDAKSALGALTGEEEMKNLELPEALSDHGEHVLQKARQLASHWRSVGYHQFAADLEEILSSPGGNSHAVSLPAEGEKFVPPVGET